MWYTYVLNSEKAKHWYTGYTGDLRKRISAHNKSKNFSTKHGIPWNLLYYEACHSKKDAKAREKFLKSGMGKRYIKNRLKFFFEDNL